MEEKKRKSFYSLAKYPTYEVLMDAQIASAGAHQARFIEKLKKNKNHTKYQFIVLKGVLAFMFVFLPVLPLVTYFEIATHLQNGTHTINAILFVSSFLFGIYFVMTILYMILLGMISTSSFMSGNAFKWLQTLPFSKKDLKKIGFMTLFRNLDIALIILIAAFPIIMLIGTQNVLIFLTSLFSSILNVVFSFSLLVIIGEKISFVFSESKGKSKKANLARIITMLGYFIIAFGTGFVLNWGFSSIDVLLRIFTTKEPSTIVNIIFSLIPYPFAPGFLISWSTTPDQVPLELLLSTLIGFALYALITLGLFRIAQRALHSTISSEVKIEEIHEKEVEVEIDPSSPIKAYLRKDLVSTTRDLQSFMFIFMPIVYPLILVLTMQAPIIGEITSIEGILILWSIILGVYLFIPPMLIVGFLNIEESGSSTIASLPVIPRDQAKAKIILMSAIQGSSLTLISIVLTFITNSMMVLLLFLITLPIAWTLLLFIFEMKIQLFGKMKYKYIIEELKKEHKVEKWILMIFSEIGLYAIILIIGGILIYNVGITIALLFISIIGIIGLSSLIFVFTRMFPKAEKLPYYVTGGFLREKINIGTLILMLLYFMFGFLVLPIELLLLPLVLNLSFIGVLFIDFFVIFGLTALLWLVVVPRGLKLPKKESFKDYRQTIGLSTSKSSWRDVLLGIGSFFIFSLTVSSLGFIFGRYVHYPWYFDNPNPQITFPYFLGWFVFVYMLIPGIWEEIAFRGVILNLQLKRYSQRTSIILNGIFFGLFHLTNLLAGFDLYSTLLQVVYASCLGIAFAYMYIKTKSLLACIITHYLIDSMGKLFLSTWFPNNLNAALFAIFGVGVIPMILIILVTNLIVKNGTASNNTIK